MNNVDLCQGIDKAGKIENVFARDDAQRAAAQEWVQYLEE
jgi:hypothetical protein